MMRMVCAAMSVCLLILGCGGGNAVSGTDEPANGDASAVSYPIVDTGQDLCYDTRGSVVLPGPGTSGYGQDAQYWGNQPAYLDNGNGTVTDLVTGLTWVQARGEKMTWQQATAGAAACRVGGYSDWRMPTIKELYSLINFTGACTDPNAGDIIPYLDTDYFEFTLGDPTLGERPIDCQDWSATRYVGTTMGGMDTAFGVNFADGRIKGYPLYMPRRSGWTEKTLFVRYVRGNPSYGINQFVDNGDGTVTDLATGLMWQQGDSGQTLGWEDALAYAENVTLAGHDDWRLPNAKELQSIVDYTRAPGVTGTAAIDPVFAVSTIEGWYWTGTTHLDGAPHMSGSAAVYIAFGRAMGYMEMPPGSGNYQHLDVHGAGAQRSDPKTGNPADYLYGHGPQGDEIRILNYARCVRDTGARTSR